jgi:predicted unusual protein kinase regulating ubiquinone biosynthesis (AarF/ABC1/UbiB family)
MDGREVAVKVQRPDVLEAVSLDLYLMRQAGVEVVKATQVRGGAG